MDEASGNFFGKQLIRSYYFKEMTEEHSKAFENEFKLDPDTVKENIYRKENPNTYLATFAKFLIDRKSHPIMKDIIHNGLKRFIEHQILQFNNSREVPIHFVGSIAFYLQDEIKEILIEYELSIGSIIRRPIDGLLNHHKLQIDNLI